MTASEPGVPRMPMVVGLDLSKAREIISMAIADPQVTIEYSDARPAPPSMVVIQQPVGGSLVTPDTQIRLTVSTGPAANDAHSSEP